MTFYRLFVASLFLICFCKKGFLKGIFANNKKLLFGVAIFGNVLPFNLISLSEIYVESIVAASPIFILNFISLNNFEKQLLLNISFESFLSATVLGIVCTGFAILIFFNLIKIKSAVFASQSNFLIPCFGSLWGYIFLDENLTENMIYGLLLIVIGGWVTNRSMFVKSN